MTDYLRRRDIKEMARIIDADSLKDDICKKCCSNDCKPDATDTITGCYLLETINSAPTIEAEPVKHVRWVCQNRSDTDGRLVYICSECGFEVRVYPYNISRWRTNEKYCAGCGARMRGDTNEEP